MRLSAPPARTRAASPRALRLSLRQFQPAVLHGQARGGHTPARGPAHDFQALAMWAGNKGGKIEIGHLGRDANGMIGGIEALDGLHAAAAVDAAVPKCLL